MIEASSIVLTYNSTPEKVFKTLDSLIIQENVSQQIIVADDGSRENHWDKIEQYFRARGVENFLLVMNPVNQGTVANCISGLSVAEGKYIKLISPGDYLVSTGTLRGWLDFLKERKATWSFSDAYYYILEGTEQKLVAETAYPHETAPYLRGSDKVRRWQYFVLEDLALGAATLGEKDLFFQYCRKMKEAGIRYGEDNMYRMLMFDGYAGVYYPKYTIFYEFGSGISTEKSEKWSRILQREEEIANRLTENSIGLDDFQRKMIRQKKRKQSKIGRLFVHGYVRYRLNGHFMHRYTPTSIVD